MTPLFAGNDDVELSSKEQYLAGVVILNRATTRIEEPQKKRYFIQLQSLTGLTEKDGQKLLEYYKEHPAKWEVKLKKIDQYLSQILSSKNNLEKNIPDSTKTLKRLLNQTNGESKGE